MTPDTSTASPHPDASREPAGGGPKRPNCSTCLYWMRGHRGNRPPFSWTETANTENGPGMNPFGECRRDCARIANDQGDAFGITHHEDWCGNHPDFPDWLALARATPSPGPAGADGAAAGGGADRG